jgi:O-antigen/teichoic acid export membrane protein
MKKDIRNNLILKIMNHGLVFLINVLMVRLLGGAQSGSMINHLYWLTSLSFLCSLGLDYAAIQAITSHPDSYRKWFYILSVASLIGIPFIFLLIFIFLKVTDYEIQSIWLTVLFTSGQTILLLFQGLLNSVKRFMAQNVVLLTTNCILCLCFFLFFFTKKPVSIHLIFTLFSVNIFSQGLIMAAIAFPKKHLHIQLPDGYDNKAILHGFKIMISTLVYFFFIRTDHFFAEKYANSISFGNYVQCGKIGQYFLLFASMISVTLLPFISEHKQMSPRNSWFSVLKPYVFVMVFATFGILIAGKFIFPLLFGQTFADMYQIMNILLPGYLALGLLTLLNAFYIGKGLVKRMLIGDVCGLIVLLLLNLLYSRNGNVFVIAIISSSCYIGLFMFMFYGVKKRLDL